MVEREATHILVDDESDVMLLSMERRVEADKPSEPINRILAAGERLGLAFDDEAVGLVRDQPEDLLFGWKLGKKIGLTYAGLVGDLPHRRTLEADGAENLRCLAKDLVIRHIGQQFDCHAHRPLGRRDASLEEHSVMDE